VTSTNDYYNSNDNHNEEKSNQVIDNRNLCESEIICFPNLCYDERKKGYYSQHMKSRSAKKSTKNEKETDEDNIN